MWAVIGRRGSGKSSLLRAIAGVDTPRSGSITKRAGLRCSYVRQSYRAPDDVRLRAIDLVRMGAERGWSFLRPRWSERSRDAALEVLRLCGAQDWADQPLAKLDAGQLRQVAIARALVSEPELLILDEPDVHLDAAAQTVIAELLDRLRRGRSMAIVQATDELRFSPTFATHALLVDREHRVALPGRVDAVLQSGAFQQLYGNAARTLRDLSAFDPALAEGGWEVGF